jgi:hypothetical protein
VDTRERKRTHRINMVKVTCLALPLSAAPSLARGAPGESWNLRLLTVVIGNKQHKQINKQTVYEIEPNN